MFSPTNGPIDSPSINFMSPFANLVMSDLVYFYHFYFILRQNAQLFYAKSVVYFCLTSTVNNHGFISGRSVSLTNTGQA